MNSELGVGGKTECEVPVEDVEQFGGSLDLGRLEDVPITRLAMSKVLILKNVSRAIGVGASGHDVLGEFGVGIRARPPVADFAIDGVHLFACKFADVLPSGAEFDLVVVSVVLTENAARFVRRSLFFVHDEADGRGGREATDADVREPLLAVEIDPDEDVGAGRDEITGLAEADSGGEGSCVESEIAKDVEEEPVLFEAVAASAVGDEFGLERVEVEGDAALEEDVEVLEGDGAGVVELDGAEGIECGRG